MTLVTNDCCSYCGNESYLLLKSFIESIVCRKKICSQSPQTMRSYCTVNYKESMHPIVLYAVWTAWAKWCNSQLLAQFVLWSRVLIQGCYTCSYCCHLDFCAGNWPTLFSGYCWRTWDPSHNRIPLSGLSCLILLGTNVQVPWKYVIQCNKCQVINWD